MKNTTITTIVTLSLIACLQARPPGVGKLRPGLDRKDVAERLALKEEQRLDHLDTHKLLKDPTTGDHRPAGLVEYTRHSFNRIVALTARGALTEEQSNGFKKTHGEIVTAAKEAGVKENEDVQKSTREQLDALNDQINQVVTAGDTGSKRTPLTNKAQHRFEEKIEFGERSGRLSMGEASRLRRKVESLSKLEERLKQGEKLSTREREKLIEEALEVRRDIQKELMD